MNENQLLELLSDVKKGNLSEKDALNKLKNLPFEDLGHAKVDHHRALRSASPEVILAQNKTPGQIIDISESILNHGSNLFITRLSKYQIKRIFEHFKLSDKMEYSEKSENPNKLGKTGVISGKINQLKSDFRYNPSGRTFFVYKKKAVNPTEKVLIITAGTSDIPIAEEARETVISMGASVDSYYDAGVAGIHRLLAYRDRIHDAAFIIVVAGMEGALASVVGGLVKVPVIAVPTSVGYGASFNGLAALLGMLNSCSPVVSVVNIDNGFGAGYIGALHVLRLAKSSDNNHQKKEK